MAELIDIANAMFRSKKDWSSITEFDKDRHFFIFNRFFSKKFPDKAQLLNQKNINKSAALDIWYYFMLDQPYPNWFWSKGEGSSDKSEISNKDYTLLLTRLRIKKEDLDYLIQNHFDIIKSELKYYKDLEK